MSVAQGSSSSPTGPLSHSASAWLNCLLAAIEQTEKASHDEDTAVATKVEEKDTDLLEGCCVSDDAEPAHGSLLLSSDSSHVEVTPSSSRHPATSEIRVVSTTRDRESVGLKPRTSPPKPRPSGRTNKKEDDRIRELAIDPEVALFTPYGVVHAKCWRYVRTDRRRRFYAGFYEKHASHCDGTGIHFREEGNFMDDAIEVYRGGYCGRIDKRFSELEEMVNPL